MRTAMSILMPILLLAACLPLAGVEVATQHNDLARTGANTQETLLTPSTVNVNTFGKLFSVSLEANVNGQVLYVPAVTINGAVHNVIYAYTSNNANGSLCGVWAFDADTGGTALWHTSLPASAQYTTATPVIDSANRIMYLLSKDTDDNGINRLHAISITTGLDLAGSPVAISGSVSGTGDASAGGTIAFPGTHANCRPGLLLLNGTVYAAFAFNTDARPYHGWIVGYRYSGGAFARQAIFCVTPNSYDGGIWQAGKGLASDGTSIYCTTGNGPLTASGSGSDYGMCVLKLDANLNVLDWFSPANEQAWSNADLDMGSCGPTIIPGSNRLFVGGTKYGEAHVVDSTHLGHFNPTTDACIQTISTGTQDSVGQNPVTWNGGSAGTFVYLWGAGNNLKQYRYDPTVGMLSPAGSYREFADTSGGSLCLSASGTGGGILWAIGGNRVIHAFAATDVSLAQLWNSTQNSARDALPSVGHFQFPTVANGKLYVPTGSASIVVYGRLGSSQPSITAFTPASGPVGTTVTITGTGFTGATATKFNTTAAAFTVDSATSITATVPAGASSGTIAVTTPGGTATSAASFTVTSAPAITTQPADQTVAVGATATFRVVATGNPAPTYQWLRNGASISGATGASYTTPPTTLADSGAAFQVVVSNSLGSVTSATAHLTVGSGAGTGLTGQYFSDMALTTSVLTRTDATVDFNWGSGSPDPAIAADHFSVRWTGQVEAPYGETYTFITNTDDGVRLWVNGQLLIDKWIDQGATPWSGTIALAAGQRYGIVMEYYEDGGSASAQLLWSSPSTPRQVIPQARLFPTTGIDFSGGFSGATGLTLNGGAKVSGSVLQLTDGGGGEARSAFSNLRQPISAFSTRFSFQISGGSTPTADGLTFAIQGDGATALGSPGGGLGYLGMTRSLAVKFDLYNNAGEGVDSTGVYLGGAAPTSVGSVDLSGRVDLHSGHVMQVELVYDGSTLSETITDTVTGGTFSHAYSGIDLASAVGGGTAWVGFTGGTGGLTAVQNIRDWSYSSIPGWSHRDIGAVGAAGSAGMANGTWTVAGSGADIWGSADAFQFVSQPLSGDGQITVRVASQTNTDPWAKAGVMIRETLDPGSRHAMTVATPGNGIAFQYRSSPGGGSSNVQGAQLKAPCWVRVSRVGSTFTGYQSSDGTNWQQVGSATIAMGANAFIGLAVTSHHAGVLSTAVFDNVTLVIAPQGGG